MKKQEWIKGTWSCDGHTEAVLYSTEIIKSSIGAVDLRYIRTFRDNRKRLVRDVEVLK